MYYVYLKKWRDWRISKKLCMLAVNIITFAVNVRHEMGTAKPMKLKLKTGVENRVTLVKLDKSY
jgi:hypothetical protein